MAIYAVSGGTLVCTGTETTSDGSAIAQTLITGGYL